MHYTPFLGSHVKTLVRQQIHTYEIQDFQIIKNKARDVSYSKTTHSSDRLFFKFI